CQRRAGRGSAVAGEANHSSARHRRDDSGSVHLADAMVKRIRDVDDAVAVHGYGGRSKERSGGGRASITGVSEGAITGKGRDHSSRVHLANTVVSGVRNVEIAA